MSVVTLNKDNFETEALHSDKPVLIDFWASWCGPCKMLSPVVDQIAEATDAVKVCKVNVDEAQDLATLVFMKEGKVVDQSVGVVPKAKILSMIGVSN